MAYQTGGGGSVADFVSALSNFAVANGWTVVKTGTKTGGGYLFIEKNLCHLTLEWFTNTTVTSYLTTGGAAVTLPNHMVQATVNASINTALTTYWGHPGYPRNDTTFNANYTARTYDLTGPLVAWHFFSNANGDYIHAAVNTQADRWTHFAFGHIDKGDLTHSGAAYVTGTPNVWYRDSNTTDATNESYYHYNRPSGQSYPFAGWGSILYVPDAQPSGFTPFVSSYNTGNPSTSATQATLTTKTRPAYLTVNGASGQLLDHVAAAHVPAWSGNIPMYGAPAFTWSSAADRLCAIGMYPDVRFINMEGMLPGQEINLSGDIWKVFPLVRQENWASGGLAFVLTSGQYAIAYKKIT